MNKPIANIEFKLVETKTCSINQTLEEEASQLAKEYFSKPMVLHEDGLLQPGVNKENPYLQISIYLSSNTQNIIYLDNKMKNISGYYQSTPVRIEEKKKNEENLSCEYPRNNGHIEVKEGNLYSREASEIITHKTPHLL